MMLSKANLLFLLLIPALAQREACAWTYGSPTATGACGNLDEKGVAGDFSTTSIINKAIFATPGVSDVLKMAFVMPSDTSTHADIILIERFGAVKYYDAAAKTLTLIGTVPGVSTASEDGLVGVAVERQFKNRVYLVYAQGDTRSTNVIGGSFRLSRFSMDPASRMMDMRSEKVILDVPSFRNRWETSGALQADLDGNLYWAVGDNGTLLTGPGNTHDLRGSILRIHPNEDGNGYTIPPGNFAAYWADKFTSQGRTALAAAYRDTSLVRPEIYIKGIRDTYAISVDPYRKQVVYGQCGPDLGSATAEVHSNSLTPIFGGWPLWSGTVKIPAGQTTYYRWNGSNEPSEATWGSSLVADNEKPVNKWTGTVQGAPGPGVDTLPPYVYPKYSYSQSCAMGSVILHYDGRVKNPGQLPPQMDNVWLMGDYDTEKLAGTKVDANGDLIGTVNKSTGIFTTGKGTPDGVNALVDLQQGPDGALYVANLNCNGGINSGDTKYSDSCSGIVRIEYQGSCADTGLYPRNAATYIRRDQGIERGTVEWVRVGPKTFTVLADGPHSIRILDLHGREAASMRGQGPNEYRIPEALAHNALYILEVKTSRGVNLRGFLPP